MPLPKLVQYLSGYKEFKNITILLALINSMKKIKRILFKI